MRNEAVHFMISELESIYISYFQACAINYSNYVKEWFKIEINDEFDFPILSLFTLATDKMIDVSILKGKYDKQIIDFITRMQNLDKEIRELKIDNSKAQLYVPVEYKAAIVKNPKDADMLLAKGEGTSGLLTVAVPRDVEKTHPYLFAEVKKRIMEEFDASVFPSKKKEFQCHDAMCITTVNHFLDDNRYVYRQIRPIVWRYTELFIEYVIQRIKNDPNYLFKMRDKSKKISKK